MRTRCSGLSVPKSLITRLAVVVGILVFASSSYSRALGRGAALLGDPPAEPPAEALLEDAATLSVLAPFRLSLGDSLESVSSRLPHATRRGLRADEARYVELGLASDDSGTSAAAGTLPSPAGTRVIEANLYFDSAETLIEASLVVELEHESDRVLLELKRLLGRPHFEVVLPGGVDTLVGWRASDGYLIGSFSDVPLFQLSAFRHEPDDILTGSYLLLFEALADYSSGLDAGAPAGRLLRDLLEIVEWVEQARKLIEPLP